MTVTLTRIVSVSRQLTAPQPKMDPRFCNGLNGKRTTAFQGVLFVAIPSTINLRPCLSGRVLDNKTHASGTQSRNTRTQSILWGLTSVQSKDALHLRARTRAAALSPEEWTRPSRFRFGVQEVSSGCPAAIGRFET